MIVTLYAPQRMFSITLPERVSGQYWLSDLDERGCPRHVASVEGIRGQWVLRGNEVLRLQDKKSEVGPVTLTSEIQVVPAYYHATNEKVQFLVEPKTKDRSTFRRYAVSGDCRLNIGRAEDNQIIFGNRFVSSHHACLTLEQGTWSITDTQSSNGTFVNQRRIATTPLKPGDTVHILGLKLIVGDGFLALNDPDGLVKVSASGIWEVQPQEVQPSQKECVEPQSETFYRSPRFSRSVVRGSIKVDAPPAPLRMEEVPLPLLLGPALTMGVTAVLMGAIAVINLVNGTSDLMSAIPTIAMSAAMLCGTLLWPMLTKSHEKKKAEQGEKRRQEKYREYLEHIRNEIYALSAQQKEILLSSSPSLADCETRILERRRDLWERSWEQKDFLRLRLGLGTLPLDAEMRFPENRFSLDDDYLMNELLRLQNEPKILSDVPITCPLRENVVTGIVGPAEQAETLLKGLVLQMAALHSYHELKLVFLLGQEDYETWSFVRWLPHVWSEDGDMRLLATDEAEAKALSAWLEEELARREENKDRQAVDALPHYVLVVLKPALAEKMGGFSRVLSASPKLGFSCVASAPSLRELPKECAMVVELEGTQGAIYDKKDSSHDRLAFTPETAEKMDLDRAAIVLANLEEEVQQEHFTLPNMLTFLELYGVGKAEHLNALTRWKENNPANTLQVPIGVGTDGETFCLDLHEKFHGPHGLVAGMTGSGKSEFIVTYILSLAVNFHPDEVAFILIDYKGGGLAGAFENPEKGVRLPHLAGTITNLDGTAVKRSLISIQSELRRRQAIFNEARRISGEGTIDIYKYQKMYRSGQVAEPIPHLFIISDEFAELKSQQPEFMNQLISAARIGRSLGIHLILATQKPSGVVDDQIWSNSRFRVCLKVQERSDSMDMIKRPDAAQISETGRFYLQVGFNEFFAMGQSAWCGAPYVPSDKPEKNVDDSVTVIDHLGRVLAEAKPGKRKPEQGGTSQIVAVVRYLSELSDGGRVAARQLWMPAIPAVIYLDDICKKYHHQTDLTELDPVVGEYDDPFNQLQGLLTLNFSGKGNVLLYGSVGSGKTTLLNTMLYGLLRDYDAARLNVYLIDLGEETLQAFEKAPQVGGVLLSGDGEKVTNLFKMLSEELQRRKKRFAQDEGDYRLYSRRTGKAVPHILVVVRNYSAFSEQFEAQEETLLQLTREGSKYGIYFLIANNSATAIRYRIAQNFAQVLPLQLNDQSEYVALLGSTDGVYPSRCKGRGIFKTDRTYEFQTAHLGPDCGQSFIRAFALELSKQAAGFARPIPVLPDRVTCHMFREPIVSEAVPIGVERESLRICSFDLTRDVINLLLGQDLSELSDVACGLLEVLERIDGAAVTVWDAARILPYADASRRQYSSNFEARIEELFREVVRRNNTYKTAVNENRPIPTFAEEIYIIAGIQHILDNIGHESRDKLVTLLDKSEREYGVRFILCDSVKGLSGCTVMDWYRHRVSESDGIWVGSGISEQYTMKIAKVSGDLYKELPAHFGYVVRKGRPVLCKLLEPHGGGEEN